PGTAELYPEVRHAVLERRGLAAVFVIIIEDCEIVDVIVLERDELSVRCGTEAHPLLGAGTMTNCLEHHLAADDKFDRLAQLPRRRAGGRAMGPWHPFGARNGTN